MASDGRKAAIAAYKERKSVVGIFELRCASSGEVWVGRTPDIEKAQNRIRFMLRQGTHPCRSLQEAWRRNGGEGIAFAIVETLDEEERSYLRGSDLKERAAFWRAKLGAMAV